MNKNYYVLKECLDLLNNINVQYLDCELYDTRQQIRKNGEKNTAEVLAVFDDFCDFIRKGCEVYHGLSDLCSDMRMAEFNSNCDRIEKNLQQILERLKKYD